MTTRIKYEFQSFLFRGQDDMLRAIAETWLSSDGSTSEEDQRQFLADQTDQQLATDCIESWGLNEGYDTPNDPYVNPWDDDERSHMAFNGYSANSLAAAFAELRANKVAITYTLSEHDDGYRIHDWFDGGKATLAQAANAGAPAAADRILRDAYLGADSDGVEVTWEIEPPVRV